MEGAKFKDATKLLEWAEDRLREEGRLTPRITEQLDEVRQFLVNLSTKLEGLTSDQQTIKYEMEYREEVDEIFEKLYKVSEEEGLIQKNK
jgi:hypothetical protein